MLSRFLHGLDPARVETWVLVFLGTGLVVLAFVGTRLLLFRAAPAAPAPEETDLDPQTDPFVYGSLSEKRSAARRRGGIIEVLLSDEKAQAEPWHGHVVDRSVGGLCLETKKRTVAGTVLTLRTVVSPPGTPWLEVKVRSCRQTRDGYLLGCQFVRIPPTGLRLLFG
jgi:hypothetical protein